MRRLLKIMATAAAAGLPAGGCSKLPSLQTGVNVDDPSVRVGVLTVTEQTGQGVAFEVPVALANPNEVTLPLRQADYTITIDGVGDYDFKGQALAAVPDGGAQVLMLRGALPVGAPGAADGLAGRAYRVRGRLEYRKPGELQRVLRQTGFPPPRVRFEGEGKVRVAPG